MEHRYLKWGKKLNNIGLNKSSFWSNVMKDKTMICIQCEKQFILDRPEQERLLSRGFGFPRRCPDCRRKKTKNVSGGREERRNKGRRGQLRDQKMLWEE
jgi:hypothetical protein